jgi:hypothetical protein
MTGLALDSVGASSLAKGVNDNACYLVKRVVLEFFASKLAPTQVQRAVKKKKSSHRKKAADCANNRRKARFFKRRRRG